MFIRVSLLTFLQAHHKLNRLHRRRSSCLQTTLSQHHPNRTRHWSRRNTSHRTPGDVRLTHEILPPGPGRTEWPPSRHPSLRRLHQLDIRTGSEARLGECSQQLARPRRADQQPGTERPMGDSTERFQALSMWNCRAPDNRRVCVDPHRDAEDGCISVGDSRGSGGGASTGSGVNGEENAEGWAGGEI